MKTGAANSRASDFREENALSLSLFEWRLRRSESTKHDNTSAFRAFFVGRAIYCFAPIFGVPDRLPTASFKFTLTCSRSTRHCLDVHVVLFS